MFIDQPVLVSCGAALHKCLISWAIACVVWSSHITWLQIIKTTVFLLFSPVRTSATAQCMINVRLVTHRWRLFSLLPSHVLDMRSVKFYWRYYYYHSSLLPSVSPAAVLTLQTRCDYLSKCHLYSPMCWKTNGCKCPCYSPWHDRTQCQAYPLGPQLDRLSPKYKTAVFKPTAICEQRVRRWYFTLSWFPPRLYDAGAGSHVGAVTAEGDKCRDSEVSLPPAQFSTG